MSAERTTDPQEGTTIGAKLMAKLGFFDNDILGPDINQDIMIDSSLENENRTAQDPIEFTEEAIYEDQMAFWESKSNRRMLLNNKKSKKKKSGRNTSFAPTRRKTRRKTTTTTISTTTTRRCGDFRRSRTRIKCTCTPRWKHPGAFGKDLMNEGLLSQVDYIAHGNEKASSLWLPQMISTKGLMASYEAFSRSKQSRIPGIAWLGKNCPDNAPKMKVLKEVSKHFPVFSIGECRRNTNEPLGLPEHKVMGSGGIDFFTKTQLALSDYLFYYVGEGCGLSGCNSRGFMDGVGERVYSGVFWHGERVRIPPVSGRRLHRRREEVRFERALGERQLRQDFQFAKGVQKSNRMATTIAGQLAVRIQRGRRQSLSRFQENLVRFRVEERRRSSRFNERRRH